jgi:hypothetical protein
VFKDENRGKAMRYKYLPLILGLVCSALYPFFSWADEIKGPDPNPTQILQVPVPDKIKPSDSSVSNPSLAAQSGSTVPEPNSQTLFPVKIQEGTSAED